MVRAAGTEQTEKKKKPTKPTIGDAEFSKLPPEQQLRIRELNDPTKKESELSTTVRQEDFTKEGEDLGTRSERGESGAPQNRVKDNPTIDLGGPKKTGIAEFRERDEIASKVVRLATDWRTTIALGATLATLGIGGLLLTASRAAAAGGAGAATLGSNVAVASNQVSKHILVKTAQGAEKLLGAGPRTAVRNWIGKPNSYWAAQSNKLFEAGGIAVRQGRATMTNPKTIAATTSLLSKLGWKSSLAAFIASEAGTVPFARFEIAEATDKIGIAMFTASQENNFELVDELNEYLNEMLDQNLWDKVAQYLPGINVIKSVNQNIAAAQKSALAFQEIIDKKREQAENGGESDFQRERRESDEAARERQLKFREEDAAFFEDIARKRDEDKRAGREEDEAFFDDIEKQKKERERVGREEDKAYFDNINKENAARKKAEKEFDDRYFTLIKEKKYEEARALLNTL